MIMSGITLLSIHWKKLFMCWVCQMSYAIHKDFVGVKYGPQHVEKKLMETKCNRDVIITLL